MKGMKDAPISVNIFFFLILIAVNIHQDLFVREHKQNLISGTLVVWALDITKTNEHKNFISLLVPHMHEDILSKSTKM